MIVPMKKVLLLVRAEERETALAALRDVGVMQIDVRRTDGTDRSRAAAENFQTALRLENRLERFAAEHPAPEGTFTPDRSDAEYLAGCGALFERLDALQQQCGKIRLRLQTLAPWGDFRRTAIDELSRRGIFVLLCSGTKNDLEKAKERDDISVVVLREDRRNADFIAISDREIEKDGLPALKLETTDDTVVLKMKQKTLEREISVVEGKLAEYVRASERIASARRELGDELEFSEALDSFEDHDAILLLAGFVPDFSVETLRAAARKNGWGLVLTDPAPDDDVPVLLKQTKWTRTIRPLFDFLGILPGYREMDVSGGILIFFVVFYAMIIGDAGYGALFLLATAAASLKFRRKKRAATPLKLSWILSVATIVWGAMCGSWFGFSFGGLKVLTDPAVKDGWIQIFCFALAVAQLSLGHIWQAVHLRRWKSIFAHIGWMLVIWGNFFLAMRVIVWPGDFPVYMYYFYGVGLALVVLFGLDWRNITEVFQFPFSVIGSFSDLLSYIRLFAVGMAGSYIAANFNGMGLDVMRFSVFFIPVGVLVLVLGHLLNLSLGLMSVLVHGVRLNTLEFSGHTGLTWSGNAFHPFAHSTLSQDKETEK